MIGGNLAFGIRCWRNNHFMYLLCAPLTPVCSPCALLCAPYICLCAPLCATMYTCVPSYVLLCVSYVPLCATICPLCPPLYLHVPHVPVMRPYMPLSLWIFTSHHAKFFRSLIFLFLWREKSCGLKYFDCKGKLSLLLDLFLWIKIDNWPFIRINIINSFELAMLSTLNYIFITRFSPPISHFNNNISPVCLPQPGDEDRLPGGALCYTTGKSLQLICHFT